MLEQLSTRKNFLNPNPTPTPTPKQEFFLVPRDAYYQRTDLQLSGRTVMGMDAPRGQALCHLLLPLLLPLLRHRYY